MHKNSYKTNKTLINNWSEEQFDQGFDDEKANRPRLLSHTEQRWKSSYSLDHSIENSATCLELEKSNLAQTTLRHRLDHPSKRNVEEQNLFINLEKTKAFPGHQPKQDPFNYNSPQNPFVSTTRDTFINPKHVPNVPLRDDTDPIRGIELENPEALEQYRDRWTRSTPVQKSSLVTEHSSQFVNHFERPNHLAHVSLRTVSKNKLKSHENERASLDSILNTIRAKCLSRANRVGILALGSSFRITDKNRSMTLIRDEFFVGLTHYGIELSDYELEQVYKFFDRDGNGFISYDEFLIGVRGTVPPRRQDLIARAFQILDTNNSGEVSLREIQSKYNARNHPLVVKGVITEEEVYRQFMKPFEDNTPDGSITRLEWDNYYVGISASIDSDELFMDMMQRCWSL